LAPHWIAFGEQIQFDRWQLKGGGIYVGTVPSWPSTSSFSNEPALLDPTLLVDTRAPDLAGSNIGYYPSYAGLKPNERGAYLAFLQSGRQLKAFGIGYVFLYYYGLERRLLIDAQSDPVARAEVPSLIAELERLLLTYGDVSGSFRHYATELRDLVRGLNAVDEQAHPPVEIFPGSPPPSLVLGIARRLASAKPLPPEWARAWTCALRNAPRFGGWRSVSNEVCDLFDLRYSARFGEGLSIAAKPARLKLHVRGAASNRSSLQFETDLPDPTLLDDQFAPLLDLLKAAIDDLEPLRGVRRQNGVDAMAELIAMPAELRSVNSAATLASLAEHVRGVTAATGQGVVALADLRTWVGQEPGSRFTKRQSLVVARALQLTGAVVEPDLRTSGKFGDHVALISGGEVAAAPGPVYECAVGVLHLAYGVIAADGIVTADERETTINQVSSLFSLTPFDRRRLSARLALIEATKPKVAKLLGNARKLEKEDRSRVAQALVAVAHADGRVDPSEVRLLERIYRALALDASQVPNHLHLAATNSVDAGQRPTALTLDQHVIAAKLSETADVQKLLAGIFSENEAQTAPIAVAENNEASAESGKTTLPDIGGLDPAHAELVRHILDSPAEHVDRATFEHWCDAVGLLPDGAIEVLNEASYDLADAPLLEGDDVLTIDNSARKALLTVSQGVCA
jgi:tellurite resistance protein